MFDRWWFEGARGPIVVERVDGAVDAKTRAESAVLLADLVRAFKCSLEELIREGIGVR